MKRGHVLIFSVVAGLLVSIFAMSVFFWNQLPAQIPVHFGLSGTPDSWAPKSVVYIFLIPMILLVMLLVFLLLYRYPQYSSFPTTLILMTVEKERREHIFGIIRSMLTYILLWVALLFSYLQFSILATANGRTLGLLPYIMVAAIAILFIILIAYSIKMFLSIRKMIGNPNWPEKA